tara:strand:- start:216 stop:494 length:279 start_codon:yes stop_codon:yes gene_type:complete
LSLPAVTGAGVVALRPGSIAVGVAIGATVEVAAGAAVAVGTSCTAVVTPASLALVGCGRKVEPPVLTAVVEVLTAEVAPACSTFLVTFGTAA